jgi:hypothetical protein
MTTKRRIGKYVPAIISFAFVLGGSWMLIPRSDDTADAEARVDVVVMTRGMPKGSSSIDVRNVATVRSLPAEARADNSFDSLDDIPDGVLAIEHSAGEQLTPSSFARNQVAAVGPEYLVTSVRLPSQQWSGAVRISGNTLDIYALGDTGARLISRDAVVLDSPPIDEVQPSEESVITIAVLRDSLAAVLMAAHNEQLWLVGR